MSSSRVVHPPGSAVPVAGACSSVSITVLFSCHFDHTHVCRIKDIYIHRNIHFRPSDSLLDLLDETRHAQLVEISRLQVVETTRSIMLHVILLVGNWRSDSGMNGRIADQSFFRCDVKKRAVIDPSVIRDASRQYLRIPCIDV